MAYITRSVADPLTITTGVAQRSILGPLLFTIYMNDLPNCLQHCKTNMYADDTAICISARDKASVTKLMQDDLINVNNMNLGKTSCMLVTSSGSIIDNQIKHVENSPYLGITIDPNLNFNIQTNNICNESNRELEALKRATFFFPLRTGL